MAQGAGTGAAKLGTTHKQQQEARRALVLAHPGARHALMLSHPGASRAANLALSAPRRGPLCKQKKFHGKNSPPPPSREQICPDRETSANQGRRRSATAVVESQISPRSAAVATPKKEREQLQQSHRRAEAHREQVIQAAAIASNRPSNRSSPDREQQTPSRRDPDRRAAASIE
ncbi:hypothetical protein HAX54_047286 [Datura stramonium]|uniref:Uncharacterized protein n=1 Tax=Datura stramonium TaxID=4076 RepID=A0ABS8SSV7_DATST|nr:hypothetical protein [Datura stramonium]